MRVMKKSTKAWSMKMRLALLALAALVWIAVPVSARAEGETVDTWDGTVEACLLYTSPSPRDRG